jgi:lactobin A/cerein 7B family class IIb bacteriocin
VGFGFVKPHPNESERTQVHSTVGNTKDVLTLLDDEQLEAVDGGMMNIFVSIAASLAAAALYDFVNGVVDGYNGK